MGAGIWNKLKKVFGKVGNFIKQGADVVRRVARPIIKFAKPIAGVIGGKWGNAIERISDVAEKVDDYAEKVGDYAEKTDDYIEKADDFVGSVRRRLRGDRPIFQKLPYNDLEPLKDFGKSLIDSS